jgi:nucleotide-binding universal stress UspA family protein
MTPIFPRTAMGRKQIYKQILIATDGSEVAGRALTHGIALAKELKASVTVVTVTQTWSAAEMALFSAGKANFDPVRQFEDMAAASAKVILDDAARKADVAGLTCGLVHIPDQHPAEGIIAIAEQKSCDLIVMASHGRRAVKRLLLGSQVNEVLAHSKVPVLVVR